MIEPAAEEFIKLLAPRRVAETMIAQEREPEPGKLHQPGKFLLLPPALETDSLRHVHQTGHPEHRVPGAGRGPDNHPHLAKRVVVAQKIVDGLERAGLIDAARTATGEDNPDIPHMAAKELDIFLAPLTAHPAGDWLDRGRRGRFVRGLAIGVKAHR